MSSSGGGRRLWEARWFQALVIGIVPVVWVVFWLGGPYAMLFQYSLWHANYIFIEKTRSLENYATIFTESYYLKTLLKSIMIGVTVAALATMIAFPLAYYIAFSVKRFKNLMFVLVIVPLWVSYLVRAYAWKVILGRDGILNTLLMSTGLIKQPLQFLLYSPFAVVVTLTHIFTPFMLLTIYSTLERVPVSYIEASKDLGVGRVRTFRTVTLPLVMPGVLAGMIFTVGLASGDFIAPVLVGGPNGVMIANMIASEFGAANNWPLGAALGFLMLMFVMFLVALSSFLERREQLA